MKISPANAKQFQQGAIIPYLMVLIILTTTIAGVAAYVSQTLNFAQRRNDMIAARQFSEGGVAVAALDLDHAFALSSGALTAISGYTVSSVSTNAVFQRNVTTPFSNQTVVAQIWMVSGVPQKVVATAVVGQVSQTATLHVTMQFGAGGAVISTNDGSTSTGVSKSVGQEGNVVVNSSSSIGYTVVDGGSGKAILANGRANIDADLTTAIPASAISMNNGSTSNEIPDYTHPGSAAQLFDFNRFIAVADRTTGGAGYLGSNHFTNKLSFMNAMNAVPAGQYMEGVIVVNIKKSEMGDDINDSTDATKGFLRGINVKGTLVFNFASDVASTDKIFDTATLNINPADLSHMVPGDSTTYTTGYPSLSATNPKNAININISNVPNPAGGTFSNFTADDDLPAMMYNIGILDMHGPVNISGVVYSPSFFEIENKKVSTQYFKGSLICGNGIFFSNETKGAVSIISYDQGALDKLATLGNNGKSLFGTYWE